MFCLKKSIVLSILANMHTVPTYTLYEAEMEKRSHYHKPNYH